ncbi:hypothetical protein ACXDF8_08055 [Mycolicibacterium sp. CBM1]
MSRRAQITVSAFAAVAVVSGTFGTAIANAKGPNLSGQTYASAAARIQSWGSKAVISSVMGGQLAIDDCIVTGSNKATFLNASGRKQDSAILLDLNCAAPLAGPGKPGNSAASPQGRKVKKELKSLAWYNKDPQHCDSSMTWCQTLCDKYPDSCSVELQQYIGAG